MRSLVGLCLGALALVHCASPVHRGAPGADRCAQFQQEYEARRREPVDQNQLRAAGGQVASVAAAGAVAVAETAVYVGIGAAVAALVCSPILIVEAAADGNGEASANCVARIATQAAVMQGEEDNYSWTRSTWEATEELRIANHDELSELVRFGADCLCQRNLPGDARRARMNLLRLQQSRDLWEKLSNGERERVMAGIEYAADVERAGPRSIEELPVVQPLPGESYDSWNRERRRIPGGRGVTRH